MSESDHKKEFRLHPETLIEAEEFLREHGDLYETYLADEIDMAFEESDVDRSKYRRDETREASSTGGDRDGE